MKLAMGIAVALGLGRFAPDTLGQTMIGGMVEQQTWGVAGSPYLVTNDVTVVSLTIQAGVEVRISPGCQINVTGRLTAVGTKAEPIRFERAEENQAWRGLLFAQADPASQFEFCVVQGAGESGVRVQGTPLTLRHCMIRQNHAARGGGINTDCGLAVIECEIEANSAQSHDANGGGIYCAAGGGRLLLQGTMVRGNIAGGVHAAGGGVWCGGAAMELQGAVITDNTAQGQWGDDSFQLNQGMGGGIYAASPLHAVGSRILRNGGASSQCYLGAGIYAADSITMEDCDISGNHGASGGCGAVGGGVFTLGIPRFFNCRFDRNAVFFTGTVDGPGYYAAAMYCSDSAYTVIQNCLVSRNTASGPHVEGAIYFAGASGTARIANCLFHGNSVRTFVGGAGTVRNSIFWGNSIGSDRFEIAYSMVPGGPLGNGNVDGSNLPVNAVFADTELFFLAEGSPAIDAGDPDPAENDATFPPSKGTRRNDMGAYGGPGVHQAPVFVPPLAITTQPKGQNVEFGGTIRLSVSVTGAEGALAYQWRRDGIDLPGARAATLVITNFAPADMGAYTVVVTDAARSVTSETALLGVSTLSLKLYAGVLVSGEVGRGYSIQATPAVGAGGVWTTLTNIVLTAPSYVFIDYESPSKPARFYRAVPME